VSTVDLSDSNQSVPNRLALVSKKAPTTTCSKAQPGPSCTPCRATMAMMMGKNRVFFPQEALDAWLVSGAIDLQGQNLLLKDEGRRYALTEGARILTEVTGETDAFDIVGKCKTLAFLHELGADILERSMIVDNNAYDIVPGFLGTPIGAEDEKESEARSTLLSDEDLLAQFLAKNM